MFSAFLTISFCFLYGCLATGTMKSGASLQTEEYASIEASQQNSGPTAKLSRASVEPAEAVGTDVRAQLKEITDGLGDHPNANTLAAALLKISALDVGVKDRPAVAKIEDQVAAALRKRVEAEASELHKLALLSKNYSSGIASAREAAEIIAMYPLSEDRSAIKQAEQLAENQQNVIRRLELIRRQRYNHWAALQVDKALKSLREGGKSGVSDAVRLLKPIEPQYLEISVSALYAYVIQELMEKCDTDKKGDVAVALTDPATPRKGMEEF